MMFKRAKQMEVTWSKVEAIQRMLEDFPLEISRLVCLVGSMGTTSRLMRHKISSGKSLSILRIAPTSICSHLETAVVRQEYPVPGGITGPPCPWGI
jgi:hypothetical protein